MQNPYEILGVDETWEVKDIKKRFRKLCKVYHPDKHENDKTAVVFFQMLHKAYESLSNQNKLDLPMLEEPKKKEPPKNVVVPGTNITENDMRILGERLKDPWFNPSFSLTEFFGDVAVPDKNKPNKTQSMRPSSTRA